MAMVFMIWRAMSGNGVKIRMTVIKNGRCCGAVLGTSFPPPCGWLLAVASIRIIGPTTTDFDVCQDRISYLFVFIDLLLEESDLEKVYGLVINRLVQLD